MHELNLWVAMSEDGRYAVGASECEACEQFDARNLGSSRRLFHVELHVNAPRTIELRATVPDEKAQASLAILAAA